MSRKTKEFFETQGIAEENIPSYTRIQRNLMLMKCHFIRVQ